MSASSLILGNFDLTGGDFTGVEVLAEGTNRGTPIPINVAVQSWMQDGAIVITQGHDNREVPIRIAMTGVDLLALAEVEAALFAELEKPNTLAWTPADGYGPTTVFDVITSRLDPTPDALEDIVELGPNPWRVYTITLTCKAFVRSVDPVVTAATLPGTATVPPTPTSVLVDDGSSAAAWTGKFRVNSAGEAALTVSSSGGVITTTTPSGAEGTDARTAVVTLTRTGSVDTSVTKQIRLAWSWDVAWATWYVSSFRLILNGSVVPRLTYGPMPGRASGGSAVFLVPDDMTTVTSIAFEVTYTLPDNTFLLANPTQTLRIDSVTRDNANTASGTPRELLRQIEVKGSARTQGTVQISHEVSALGDVLAYFWPVVPGFESYSPALRQYRVSGPSPSIDPGSVSGAVEVLTASDATSNITTFEIPAGALSPGGYLIAARLAGDGATVIKWTATTILGSNDVGPSETHYISLPLTPFDGDDFYALGRVQLPTRDVGSDGRVRITMAAQPGKTVYFDEGAVFNTTIGQLTHVVCGSGTPAAGGPSSRVWIEPATIDKPRPTVRVGTLASGADAHFPLKLRAWTPPQFPAGAVNVFTMTTTAVGAAVTLIHTPAWHTNAAA